MMVCLGSRRGTTQTITRAKPSLDRFILYVGIGSGLRIPPGFDHVRKGCPAPRRL